MSAKRPPEGYVFVPDAANMMGIAPQTLYVWLGHGKIPYKVRESGTRRYYYIKKTDVDEYVKQRERLPHRRRRVKTYEIVTISCGDLTVLYTTNSLFELSKKYIHMLEHDHKLIRVRADGELLTIHESDRVGNTYHPRTKKGC